MRKRSAKTSFVVAKYDGLSYVWKFVGANASVVYEASEGSNPEVVDVIHAKPREKRV